MLDPKAVNTTLSGKQFSGSDAELQPRILLNFSCRLVDPPETVRFRFGNSEMGRPINGVVSTLMRVSSSQRILIVVVRLKQKGRQDWRPFVIACQKEKLVSRGGLEPPTR